MRLINADKLMNVYADRLVKVSGRYGIDSAEAGILSGAMKLLEVQPTVQPERKTGKWIPCSEGYPEMDERVLVNLDGRYDIHAWDCMSNRGDSYFWEDESGFFRDKYEVLYWMRIPELSGDE